MNTPFFAIADIVLCICWVIWTIRNYKSGKKGLCILTVIGSVLWGLYAIRDILR